MLNLKTNTRSGQLEILCLGAHCDDIEIGCGATIRKLVRENPGTRVSWCVLSSNPEREAEARKAAERITGGAAASVSIETFRNGFFPYVGAELKDYFESLKSTTDPDIVFTHFGSDCHQDHRLVSELTWNTFRNHMILEYEIPKYDGDLGAPNFFSPVSIEDAEFKVATIIECFETQAGKHWFDRSTFLALMRLRGMECNAESSYAEAFYVRKAVVDF